jgi:hypothetical protein
MNDLKPNHQPENSSAASAFKAHDLLFEKESCVKNCSQHCHGNCGWCKRRFIRPDVTLAPA